MKLQDAITQARKKYGYDNHLANLHPQVPRSPRPQRPTPDLDEDLRISPGSQNLTSRHVGVPLINGQE